MTTTKEAMLDYLKKEEKRLQESIDRFMSIGLDDMEHAATAHLRAVQSKIKELEEE